MAGSGRQGNKHGFTKEFLFEEHVTKGKNAHRISREVGCCHKTVAFWMDYFQIERQATVGQYRRMQTHGCWSGYAEISRTQFNNIRNNAKTRGIAFEVTIEELWAKYVEQDRRCALSGVEIGFVSSKRGNASLDRIDSGKPYVLGNIQWLHTDVNLAKQSLTTEQFIALCQRVVNCTGNNK